MGVGSVALLVVTKAIAYAKKPMFKMLEPAKYGKPLMPVNQGNKVIRHSTMV